MNNKFIDTTTGIGNVIDNDIIDILFSSGQEKNIIKENLKNITSVYFPDDDIQHLAERTIYFNDKDIPIMQYQVEIGRTVQHENESKAFQQSAINMIKGQEKMKSELSLLETSYKPFKVQLHEFYLSCFTAKEDSNIKEAIEDNDLYHVIIYCHYFVRLRKTDIKLYKAKEIVAAVSFKIASLSAMLVYFGVSDKYIIVRDCISSRNKITQHSRTYRKKHLGTVCLCLVQKITKLKTKKYIVVCETNQTKYSRTNKFYYKMYFSPINYKNKLIKEHNNINENSFHKSTELIQLVSVCPIYLMHPIDLKKKNALKNIDLIEKIFKGANIILKLERKKLFQLTYDIDMICLFTLLSEDVSGKNFYYQESKYKDELSSSSFFNDILQ